MNELPKLGKYEMRKQLLDSLEELADSIVTDPKELRKFGLKWRGNFYQYSLNNYLLAKIQMPDCSLLASYKEWQRRGRQVRKGEKGLLIMAPSQRKIIDENGEETVITYGYHFRSCFDISQTIGSEIEDIGCADMVTGKDLDFDYIASKCDYPVELKDLGLANARTNCKRIQITPKSNKRSMISSLIHEWAHAALKHCERSGTLQESNDRSVKEQEAEIISHLVCSILGIENKRSPFYLGRYGATSESLKGRGTKLLAVSEKIIRTITAKGDE